MQCLKLLKHIFARALGFLSFSFWSATSQRRAPWLPPTPDGGMQGLAMPPGPRGCPSWVSLHLPGGTGPFSGFCYSKWTPLLSLPNDSHWSLPLAHHWCTEPSGVWKQGRKLLSPFFTHFFWWCGGESQGRVCVPLCSTENLGLLPDVVCPSGFLFPEDEVSSRRLHPYYRKAFDDLFPWIFWHVLIPI